MDGENGVEVPKSKYSGLFKLLNNGTLEILRFDQVYKLYQVYIDINNGVIWSETT